jgi:hypothetical protein
MKNSNSKSELAPLKIFTNFESRFKDTKAAILTLKMLSKSRL